MSCRFSPQVTYDMEVYFDVIIPKWLVVAFVETGTCPVCLDGALEADVCRVCGSNLGPLLDAIEASER